MAASQVSCPEVEALKARPSLRVSMATLGELQLLCDFSTGLPRPLLPPAFRMAAFTAVHSLAHPGIIATQRLMSTRWLWAGMAVDTPRWCKDCQRCQRAKVTKQPRATLQPMVILALRFSHLHLDLVGPLLRSAEGCNHILTIVDRSSRWLEAIPLSSTTTATAAIANAFVAGWVARFGVPEHITSDRGPQFCSDVWAQLTRHLGYLHHLTTAYHTQANSMVERCHRQLKDALRACTAGGDWSSHLLWVLLGLRAAPKEASGISSAEVAYGTPLVLPSQLSGILESPPVVFKEDIPVASSFIPSRAPSTSPPDSTQIPQQLQEATFVYVCRGGSKPTAGHLW